MSSTSMGTGPIAAALALALAAAVSPSPTRAETHQVTLAGTQFLPAMTTLARGDGVTWANAEAADYPTVIGKHNVIPDEEIGPLVGEAFPMSGPLLRPGESWTCTGVAAGLRCAAWGKRIVIPPGTYAYKCGLHPRQMRGILTVE